MQKILRLPAVMALNGLSRSTNYNHISQGLWPPPITLGARAIGFLASECEIIISARIAGKTDTEIKALVVRLLEKRNDAALHGATDSKVVIHQSAPALGEP